MDFEEILRLAVVLADSDSEGEINDEEGRLQILIDADSWKRLGDPTFEQHFRMDTSTFEILLVALGHHLEVRRRWLRRSKRGLDFALMMVLWILASPDTFRSVGVKFGVTKGVVHFHYKYIIEALREMAPQYIKWPDNMEREMISEFFEDLYGYPGVCGCIDGCHISVTAPLEQPQRYVDRKKNYSILLQAVCDHRMLFRDVYVGEPGSVGDKATFKKSPLGKSILRDPNVVGDLHLLGDGGYTLTSKLLIPYKDNGRLTRCQKVHNYYVARCRSIIERSFALLKGKWRRLKYFPNYCLDYAIDHITACVMLHNFIILEGNAYEEYEDCDADAVNPDDMMNPERIRLMRQLLVEAKTDGVRKRNFIAAQLFE